jgi:hypothetical protein
MEDLSARPNPGVEILVLERERQSYFGGVVRRLRIFGQQDKLRADRSKGRETWA